MGPGEITALVVAFGGAVTGIIAWRKTKAEAESIAVATSIELIEVLRGELKEMRTELDDQRSRRQDLAEELHELKESYSSDLRQLRNRVDTLETWIQQSTSVDPSTIA
jgi:uncharacterized coiled-coil DUF342 family protein